MVTVEMEYVKRGKNVTVELQRFVKPNEIHWLWVKEEC